MHIPTVHLTLAKFSSHAALALAAAALTGCVSDAVTASSRTYLGPSGSGVVVSHPADETALEIIHLLQARGYLLDETRVDPGAGERRLKFSKSNRQLSADNEFFSARDVGSVFYAWVTPEPDGAGATVSLLGKPTLAGVEPCTNDGVLLNCTNLRARRELADRYLRARHETEVARGVLTELQLAGFVVRALPADSPPPMPDAEAKRLQDGIADCHLRQHEATVAAGREKDPDKHAALIRAVPHCEGDR